MSGTGIGDLLAEDRQHMQFHAYEDTPDPDNIFMNVGLKGLAGDRFRHIVISGRGVNMNATSGTPLYNWVYRDSMEALSASAARVKNIFQFFNVRDVHTYNGRIADLPCVPHYLHFKDYYKFHEDRYDPIKAVVYSELEELGPYLKHALDAKHLCFEFSSIAMSDILIL